MNEDTIQTLVIVMGLIIVALIITSTVTRNLTMDKRLELILSDEGTICYNAETLIKLDC